MQPNWQNLACLIMCLISLFPSKDMNVLSAITQDLKEDFRSELDKPKSVWTFLNNSWNNLHNIIYPQCEKNRCKSLAFWLHRLFSCLPTLLTVPIEIVHAVYGQRAQLPCDISTTDEKDSVSMVLWFRDFDGEPLYSFDVRSKSMDKPKFWSSSIVFKERAKFITKTQPAFLLIDPIRIEDETIYRCRVDFKNSPTKNSKVNLTVIKPPSSPIILDDKNRDLSNVNEPFNEGSEKILHCEVTGGKPRPRIDWYLEEKLLYGVMEFRSSPEITAKKLILENISRDLQNKKLSCHASNTNLIPPAISNIILNINLKPLYAHIFAKQDYVSTNKEFNVECRCFGSKPRAQITWWLGSRQIMVTTLQNSLIEGNMMDVSIISFKPSIEDDGKYLTCRAGNPLIENSAVEDKWRLNVQYPPILNLKIGPSLNADHVKEGDDVYFECYIKANPKIHKFSWFHNGATIPLNISTKVIKTDHNLILQHVKKLASGNFTCHAANIEGSGESNPVVLNVKYAPVCEMNNGKVYGTLKSQTILLQCNVDANPPAFEYFWVFNNSEDIKTLYESSSVITLNSPFLNYTPKSDSEFGTLSCKARNEVGLQDIACFFPMVTAGQPHPLSNCSIKSSTTSQFQIECNENFDGGLPQFFLMEVWELNGQKPMYTVTQYQTPPVFQFEYVDKNSEYEIQLFSMNAKGRSEPVVLRTSSIKGVAMHTKTFLKLPFGFATTVSFLLGTCFATSISVAIILICCRRKKPDAHVKVANSHDDFISHGAMLAPEENVTINHNTKNWSDDDPDPDIITNTREREVPRTSFKFYTIQPLRKPKKSSVMEHAHKNKCRTEHFKTSQNLYHLQGNFQMDEKSSSSLLWANTTLTPEKMIIRPACYQKFGSEVVTASNRLQESCL